MGTESPCASSETPALTNEAVPNPTSGDAAPVASAQDLAHLTPSQPSTPASANEAEPPATPEPKEEKVDYFADLEFGGGPVAGVPEKLRVDYVPEPEPEESTTARAGDVFAVADSASQPIEEQHSEVEDVLPDPLAIKNAVPAKLDGAHFEELNDHGVNFPGAKTAIPAQATQVNTAVVQEATSSNGANTTRLILALVVALAVGAVIVGVVDIEPLNDAIASLVG